MYDPSPVPGRQRDLFLSIWLKAWMVLWPIGYGDTVSLRIISLSEMKKSAGWELVLWGFDSIRNHRIELVLETEYDEFGKPVIFTADREVDDDPDESYPDIPF